MSQEETTKFVAGKSRLDTASASHNVLATGWLLVSAGFFHVAASARALEGKFTSHSLGPSGETP